MNYGKFHKRTKYNAEKQNKKDNYTFLNNNYCKKGQTVLVGDSITEIYNSTELFEDYTEKTGIKVYNRGISGDTSDRLLERFYDNVITLAPRNIVMLIGTNDLTNRADTDFTADNISSIIKSVKDNCPSANMIIMCVYPINPEMCSQYRHKNRDIIILNEKIERLCGEQNICCLNLNEKLADEKGCLSEKFTYDGLHLNAKAFELVTNNLLAYLK